MLLFGVILYSLKYFKIESITIYNYTVLFNRFSNLLIICGIIYLIIYVISKKITMKIFRYIDNIENNNNKISEKNDLLMKEKKEKAKHSNFVKCPYCGADNIITEKIDYCKFCRRKLKNDIYK